MSLPAEYARKVVVSMQTSAIRRLVAQAKAKQVLREVHEIPENFPQFTPNLDERVTFVAYGLLAAGCSLIEQGMTAEGAAEIQTAAELLQSAHKTEIQNDIASAFHCLLGAMAFYACGQYSRAFVLIREVEALTPVAGVIGSFLRKDATELINRLNAVLLAPSVDLDNGSAFDDWAMTIALSRAVASISEFGYSGDSRLFENAQAVLQDATIISENSSHPSFWWIARLLRLMLNDYGRGSLWNVLPPYFDPDGASEVGNYIRLLAFSKPPVTELWQSQLTSLPLALNQNNNGGVINLRTSAGKTRVAELAILKTLNTFPNSKVLYLAPFRSLAFELERTFNKSLSPLGYSISHLYGGSRFSRLDKELAIEANITIATPEKAKAMLRAAPELFESIKLVVVDEGHLLGGNERDVRNELFLDYLRLSCLRRKARMLLLSAVLPNAADLASWIAGDPTAIAKSDWKPSAERFGLLRWTRNAVKIEWQGDEPCFNPNFVDPKMISVEGRKRRFPRTKPEAVAATAVRLLELGPVLIFAGQAQWVEPMVKGVLIALGDDAPAHPWPETEWKIFEGVCNEELGEGSLIHRAASVGVICHSNRLPPQVRMCIERLMAQKPPKIIVATTTLGQGVNIGISSVIVATTYIGKMRQIKKRDFWNICGRAGRAFVDGEGKILFAIDGTRSRAQIANDEANAKAYFNIAQMDRVGSGLLLIVRILHRLAARANISFDVLLELVANSDLGRCGEVQGSIKELLDLIDDQLLALHILYKGDEDASAPPDWVDDAFRNSLAAIQERQEFVNVQGLQLIEFLKARIVGVLREVPLAKTRRAILASGLPLSTGIMAFNNLDAFRAAVDRYANGDSSVRALNDLIKEFEMWARENAKTITENMPNQEILDVVRPLWLGGEALRNIVESCGEVGGAVCRDLYGYQLPWLFHAIAQKLDKATETERIEVLSKVGLLVELGLPNESAAKVYMAGVRSRKASVELGNYVTNASASVNKIRAALLSPPTVASIRATVSPATLEWIRLLSAERGESDGGQVNCAPFSLQVPDGIDALHARKVGADNTVYLCSTDGRYRYGVTPTREMPFDKLCNDPRYVFIRAGQNWNVECRDPRVQVNEV